MATTTYPTQDSQKGKLYAAERSTEWTTKASELISEAEVTALATKACKWLYSKGYRPCTTHPTVAFPGNGRGGAWASRGQRKLSFTPAARKRWVVLHEVAHLVLPSNHPEYDGDDRPHGWCFADVYLKLVSRFCGRSNANALKAQLKARKVRIRPKRKLTEAQRSAAADRLAAGRTRWRSNSASTPLSVTVRSRLSPARPARTPATSTPSLRERPGYASTISVDPSSARKTE